MKKAIIIFGMVLLSGGGLKAQSITNEYAEPEVELFKWINGDSLTRFLHFYAGGTSFLEHFNSDVIGYDRQVQSGLAYFTPHKLFPITLIQVALEPRIDILQYNDLVSASLNIPATAAFSFLIDSRGPNDYFGHVTLPFILQANFFRQATYADIDRYGFSVGAGVQYVRLGLLYLDDAFALEEPFEFNRNWWHPAGRVGFTFGKHFSTQSLFGLNPIRLTYDTLDDNGNRRQNVTYARFYWNMALFYKF